MSMRWMPVGGLCAAAVLTASVVASDGPATRTRTAAPVPVDTAEILHIAPVAGPAEPVVYDVAYRYRGRVYRTRFEQVGRDPATFRPHWTPTLF